MTMEGCTRVISRAEVEEVVQGCTIHTGAPGVFLASITVHTSEVWGLHTLSIHRPHHSHPNTFSRRRPRLQHPRYPMSTNATRTRSTGEFISLLLLLSDLRYISLIIKNNSLLVFDRFYVKETRRKKFDLFSLDCNFSSKR